MSISDAVARAAAYLAEHPDEARYRDSAATARIESGLVASVIGPGGEQVQTDIPAGIGGTATTVSPGWLLRAAAASCVASLIVIRASALGLTLGPVEVTVDSESDDRGILGIDDSIDAGALSMRVVVAIGDPSPTGQDRQDLVSWALRHCPVTDTVARAVPISVEVR